jgi:hypothetical protein
MTRLGSSGNRQWVKDKVWQSFRDGQTSVLLTPAAY